MSARHVPFDEWLSLALFVFGEVAATLWTIQAYWPVRTWH
jgi:hypothetical protein